MKVRASNRETILTICAAYSLIAGIPVLASAQDPVNIDELVEVGFSGLRLNRATRTYDNLVSLHNLSSIPIGSPVSVVIKNIDPTDISLANAAGITETGDPFIDVLLEDDILLPNETAQNTVLKFNNPQRSRITFDYAVFGVTDVGSKNNPPISDAGPDKSVFFTGETVAVDGGNSSDVDGDPITFSWVLISAPDGSRAELLDPTAEILKFVVDVFGEYVVQLIVNDGALDSAPDTVTITTENSTPAPPILNQHATHTRMSSVTITGKAGGASSVEVFVSGNAFDVPVQDDGTFGADVLLGQNRVNHLSFTSIFASGLRSAPTVSAVTHDNQAPKLFIDFPQDTAELTTATIDVAGRVGDLLSGFMGLTVSVNGITAIVDVGIGNNGTFLASDVPLEDESPTVITATATDELGNSNTRQITVDRLNIPADMPSIGVVSGNDQSGPVNQILTDLVVVEVLRGDGTPFVNKLVTFKIIRSDGRLFTENNGTETMELQIRTDGDGLAKCFWRLGSDAGCGNNRIEVVSRDVVGSTFFCATAFPGTPDQINVGSGDNQRVEVGGSVPEPLRVWVSDSCNGVANVPVTFTVVQGEGIINGSSRRITTLTSDTGHAEVDFVLGTSIGLNIVKASFEGNQTEPVSFNILGIPRELGAMTTFSGKVLDNSSRPIGGARCVLTVVGTMLPEVFTDTAGEFSFIDIPAGPAQFHVDGLLATMVGGEAIPQGSYPALSYSIVVVPNAQNQLPKPILLPQLNANNAVVYDGTQDVELTCEGMDGLRMFVKAGSVTLADESVPTPGNPTILSLNQVHHDDVPMPMPDGAAPLFAWTLQPAGATFNPPVKIEYPNMSGLPPGAIAFFLSFDHDTERFEIVASGHVVRDGSTILTDPEAGLRLAGWGCNCPPYSVTAECKKCCD